MYLLVAAEKVHELVRLVQAAVQVLGLQPLQLALYVQYIALSACAVHTIIIYNAAYLGCVLPSWSSSPPRGRAPR